MTADIIHLTGLGCNDPAPKPRVPIRCFIYEFPDTCRVLAVRSMYTIKSTRWSVARAVTSECHELWATVMWLLKEPHVRDNKEKHEYAIFSVVHPERIGRVWVVAARAMKRPKVWVVASSVNMNKLGIYDASLVAIQAREEFIWIKGEGFRGSWAGIDQPGGAA